MTTRVRIEVESPVSWWRPLVQWLLCVPHLVYTVALTAVSLAVAVAIVPCALVTGRVPSALLGFQVLTLRERVRCYSYFFVLRSSRPPYTASTDLADPGDDPLVEVSVDAPGSTSRWSVLARPFVVLPHLAVLAPIGLVMDACYPVWMLLAAANRGWPEGLERTLIRIERWVAAVAMYALFVTDEPPGFGLAAYDEDGDGVRLSLAG